MVSYWIAFYLTFCYFMPAQRQHKMTKTALSSMLSSATLFNNNNNSKRIIEFMFPMMLKV